MKAFTYPSEGIFIRGPEGVFMKKYREDLELIALSKAGDLEAQFELWKKWESFTGKQFFKSKELFDSVGVSYEEYMQEAYLIFVQAVAKYNFEKAKTAGSSKFSTCYYWYIRKYKGNLAWSHKVWGNIKMASEYTEDPFYGQPHKDDTYNEWNVAIQKDIKDDFKKAQAAEILEIYFQEEENPLYRKITHFLLMGETPTQIAHTLDDEYPVRKIRSMIAEIYGKIKTIADKTMFEPIFC